MNVELNHLAHILEISKSTGGVGSYTRRLVKGLNKERFRITVVCLSTGAESMAAELSKIPGVTAHGIPMNEYHIDPFSDIQVLFRLMRFVRREKFDIIHAHTSKPGFLIRVAALGTGIPVIYRPANFSFDDSVPKLRAYMYSLLERFAAYFLTSRIVIVSNGERELARRYHVGADSQFIRIYTGIDLSEFVMPVDVGLKRTSLGVPPDIPLVGTVSRLTKDKGPFVFVEAASLVHARFPSAHFLWVGDGPLEKEVKERVHTLKMDQVFHFLGIRDDVPEILKILDCFALSSYAEGFSIAMLEAMASALPVVVTMTAGADEAIENGKTGLLVPIGGVKELADSILLLLNNPMQAREMGKSARIFVEGNFSLERMVQGTERLYEMTLKKNASGFFMQAWNS